MKYLVAIVVALGFCLPASAANWKLNPKPKHPTYRHYHHPFVYPPRPGYGHRHRHPIIIYNVPTPTKTKTRTRTVYRYRPAPSRPTYNPNYVRPPVERPIIIENPYFKR